MNDADDQRQGPGDQTAMTTIDRMSDFLLRLYAIGQERSVSDFLPSMLAELKRHLPFDSAWWALTKQERGSISFQASHVEGLPSRMHELWLSIQDDDVIGHAVLLQPGRTLNFSPAAVERTHGGKWLAHRTGFRNVLCTQLHNPATDQNWFLALSRHDDFARFTSAEQRFKQLLMQHVEATTAMNHNAYLNKLRDLRTNDNSAAAIVDRAGLVHAQETRFPALMRREWPEVLQRHIPAPLLRSMTSGDQSFQGRRIRASISSLGSFSLVELIPRSPVDDLTRRERQVASAFAEGKSYKEISRHLGMAPATVRHHLRMIYAKLNVSNKAQVVQLVGFGDQRANDPSMH